ncbi:MAG: DUF3604 domain-containing protein [Myxococcota bacterium]
MASDRTASSVYRIEQREDRYLRDPRWRREGKRALLRCRAWNGQSQEWTACFMLGQGGVQGLEDEAAQTVATAAERFAERGGAAATVVVEGGVAEVRLLRPWSALVWRGRGSASSPCVLETDAGVLVAFHHSVREDTGEDDVAKWIALRLVNARGVFEPAADMVGRDRDLRGEEQSFEVAELAEGPDGAIALFGRGSHNFYRQDLNAQGFAPRVALGSGEWGSRGRRCTALSLGARLWTARRERYAIVVEESDAPSGGPPAWRARAPHPVKPRTPRTPIEDGIFFGDIQQHSAHSDGTGSADEAYLRARDRYADDFVALTDHESFLGKRTSPSEWRYLQDVADRYDDPGRFVTLLAYEWTGKRHPGPGHKCVYVPRRGMPIVSRDTHPSGHELLKEASSQGFIASPHHIGWTGSDADAHREDAQPVWEICSCHGCYEFPDHPLGARGDLAGEDALSMLKRGLRFGFTASSDSHGLLWHHGESRKRDPYRTGLTAVLAPALTRQEVYEALAARRCYATSGAKIRLHATADGRPMGSEGFAGTTLVDAEVQGTAPIVALELIGPEGVMAEGRVGGTTGSLTARVSIDRFAYVRVRQSDDEWAWASPFFSRP